MDTPSGGPPAPGWYPDPWGHSPYRWWNGGSWEGHVWPPQEDPRRPPELALRTARPVTTPIRRLSTAGLVTVISLLAASIALSSEAEAASHDVSACSSVTSPLVGDSILALVCGTLLAVPALWATVRVLRARPKGGSAALRVAGGVLVVVGIPIAAGSALLVAFSYACLF